MFLTFQMMFRMFRTLIWRRAKKFHTRWNLVPWWNCGLQISPAASRRACQGACQIHGWSFSPLVGTFSPNPSKSDKNQTKSGQITKSQHVEIWGCQFWFGFRTRTDVRNRICSQDQHAQAQHWLRQAQLMHAQHWPRTQSRSRQGGGLPPPCLVRTN